MKAVAAHDRRIFEPHQYRWFNLHMCGLINPDMSVSERSALNRSIRTLAQVGLLEAANKFPYDLLWVTNPKIYGEDLPPLDIAILDPRPPTPGRPLWFRKTGHPQLFTDDNVQNGGRELEEVLPKGDATWKVVREVSRYPDGQLADYAASRDPSQATQTSYGRFLRWYFYGPNPTRRHQRKRV